MTFNSSKLSNGLTITTFNMPTLNSVAINLIVKVGSRYESSNEAGISHFLEHMAFKGTSNRSAKNIAEEFDAIGGHFNAYTSREQTVYFAKVLYDNFPKALTIIADIIQNSVFANEDIEKELNVILQEIAGVYDNPDELVYEKFSSTAYTDQSLGRSILGSENTLNKIDKNYFLNFLEKYYHAENMFLSVAGKIDHEDVVKIASNLFSSMSNQPIKNFEPAQYTGGYHYINKDLEQTTLILGFESVPYLNLKEYYHSQILSIIFGGGISSRLFQQIRENLGLAYSVGSYTSAYYDSGVFSIYASTHPEKSQLLIDNLILEIKKIIHKISEDELSRSKAQIKASIYMAEEKSVYKSEEIGKNFSIFSKYFSSEEIINLIMSINISDVINIAQKIFYTKPTISVIGSSKFDAENYHLLCKEILK